VNADDLPDPDDRFLFDTVFTLSDLSVVYLLTQAVPPNASKDPHRCSQQTAIQAGNLGRGAPSRSSSFPAAPR